MILMISLNFILVFFRIYGTKLKLPYSIFRQPSIATFYHNLSFFFRKSEKANKRTSEQANRRTSQQGQVPLRPGGVRAARFNKNRKM
jgi:hypothetical protein